jgi:hypothetical protein
MKLVSFAIETWLAPMRCIGALIDGEQDGLIADLTSAYTNYLKWETDAPTPDELGANGMTGLLNKPPAD